MTGVQTCALPIYAAIYLDLENQLCSFMSFGLAGRAEKYSDFGSTWDGKFSVRIELIEKMALRGSVSSGFRAPSLAQSYYSSTVTNFIDGEPYENGTFIVDHPLSRQMGAKALKPEKSLHHSAGLVFQPNTGFQFTCDFYYTRIYDRIIFSGNFTADNAPAFATLLKNTKWVGRVFLPIVSIPLPGAWMFRLNTISGLGRKAILECIRVLIITKPEYEEI